MAKYGEGDKRWIVEERPDGANVHNWHWVERNCLAWSRTFLSDLLSDLTVLSGESNLVLKTKSLDKLEGEAYVNIRKGKIIPGYELSISVSFEGQALKPLPSDSAESEPVKVRGTLEVPYLADENANEDPEVKIVVRDGEGGVGDLIRGAFQVKGKDVVLAKLREYVQAMDAGGPAKDELEAKKWKSQKQPGGMAPVAAPKEVEEKRVGFKSITLTEKFNCRPRDVYEILMDESMWKGFTQSNAKISREVGGEFNMFDSSISGVNMELKQAELIVQKWRFNSWVDGIYSTVRLEFNEPEMGTTFVKLTQIGVPVADRYGNATVLENTENGWRDLIFHKIKGVFGFGL